MRAQDIALGLLVSNFWKVRNLSEPKFEGLPVNHQDDLEREQGVFKPKPEKATCAESAGFSPDRRNEGCAFLVNIVDIDGPSFIREAELKFEGVSDV